MDNAMGGAGVPPVEWALAHVESNKQYEPSAH